MHKMADLMEDSKAARVEKSVDDGKLNDFFTERWMYWRWQQEYHTIVDRGELHGAKSKELN
jgi:hypothetical protein